MKVQVDLTRCVGYAQCCFTAPRVFRMSTHEALEFDATPELGEEDAVRRAAAVCPVQAIKVGEMVTSVATRRRAPTNCKMRVVVVGASLAGLRAGEAICREAPGADLTIVGDEAPYDRPQLSKGVLLGRLGPEDVHLAQLAPSNARWLLGRRAVGLNRNARHVTLDGGEPLEYDRLLIATGARARAWLSADEAIFAGVFTLRSLTDALGLRDALASGPRRVAVIGAGFIGSEVASVCRTLGIAVTLIERGPGPLARALGAEVGSALADLQRRHGVDLRLQTNVERLEAEGGRVSAIRLTGGERIEADVVVVALGAVRNTEWLKGCGVQADATGVLTDEHCRVVQVDGASDPHIFAAGDVARFPSPLFEAVDLSVEHWSNALEGAETAGFNLVAGDGALRSYRYLPTFWTSQFGRNIKGVGRPGGDADFALVQGALEDFRFAGVYGIEGRTVGAITDEHGRYIDFYAGLVGERAPFPPRFRPAYAASGVAQ